MSDFVTLTCPSCGGKLQITNDIERFACAHCGREHIVKRSGGVVALTPVVDALKKVEAGVDRTASELAIARLEQELQQLSTHRNALLASIPGGPSPLGIVIAVSGILVASVAFFTIRDNPSMGATCLVTGLVAMVAGSLATLAQVRVKNSRQETIRPQVKSIEQEYSDKKRELARHRNTVAR
jgi:uncharacterized protein (DUF983 family)